MKLELAESIAARVIVTLAPLCDRLEIAGGVRRGKSEVHDLEIIALPRWESQMRETSDGLFTVKRPANVNLLCDWALGADLIWIHAPKPHGRNWRGTLGHTRRGEPFNLDFYLTEPQRWGATLLVRTGDGDFSKSIATYAKYYTAFRLGQGGLMRDGIVVDTPEEETVFELLGLPFVEPQNRTAEAAINGFFPSSRR